jgi:hypothetical protein
MVIVSLVDAVEWVTKVKPFDISLKATSLFVLG